MDQADHARPLAWAIAALALTLTAAGLALGLPALGLGTGQPPNLHLLSLLVFGTPAAITYGLLGALVAARQPRNPIGWLLGAVGALCGLLLFCASYRHAAEVSGAALPGIDLVRWLGLWLWIPPTILPLTFLLLLFPDGRLPSARWRPVAWAGGLGLAAFAVVTALHPRPPIEPTPPVNPFGLPGAVGALDLLWAVANVLLPVAVFGALAALVARFRRARGVERTQVQWLAYAAAVGILGLVGLSAWSAARPDDVLAHELVVSGVWVALSLIGGAAGVAILRHRLYDIDLLINRTLVYGALSAAVVGGYVLLVGALGALFQASAGPLVGLVATGLVALLVQPLRARVQRGVNRLLYGERDDPYAVLSRLSQQLTATLAPAAVLPGIAEAVARALKLPYVALALVQGDGLEMAAAYGQPVADPVRLPLVYQTQRVGQLLVAPRAPGEVFTPAERRLLDDIARQAGVAAHAVRLAADVQRSRERLVTAREEERRRLRRDLHDGLGPQLASLTLTLAAARELLRRDADAADALLREVSAHAQAAIADIRRVAHDLRPPALDDLGLAAALREHADRCAQAGLRVVIDAPEPMPPLPAAVEVAAYRIAQEALTNVVRHAGARTAQVRLALGDSLEVEVRDDGVGLPSGIRAGVGLLSMRERAAELGGAWALETAPGRGTCIRVRLPLHREGA